LRNESLTAIFRHVRVLWRAETLIVEIKLRQAMRRAGLMAFAGLIAVFGLAMLNVAAYFALAPLWGDAWAMLAVAVADFVIAGVLIAMASSESSSRDLDFATELRDQAIEGIEVETKVATDRLVHRPVEFAGSMSSILFSLLTGFLRGRKNR
jgi:hypothetical protein